MLELTPEQAEQAARMTPGEWSAHLARYRAPDTFEQVRAGAVKHVDADRYDIDALMTFVDPAKFLGSNGQVDDAKIERHFSAFGTKSAQPARQWGQHSGAGQPPKRPGESGRLAAQKRHNVKPDTDQAPGPGAPTSRGAGARAEITKRYPKGTR